MSDILGIAMLLIVVYGFYLLISFVAKIGFNSGMRSELRKQAKGTGYKAEIAAKWLKEEFGE